jgi:hypothetical protein
MALYGITIDALALVAATAKTVIELGTTSTDRAKIIQWWVEFDGATSTAVPVKIEAQRFSAAVTTATTLAGDKLDPADGAAATVAKHSTTTEGAGTATAGSGEIHRVHPQGGILIQYPLGRELVIPVSAFWRIRCTAAAGVNVTAGVIWEE